MGPIDAVAQVISSPGEKVMMGANPSPVTFAGDTSEVTLDEIDPQNPQGRQGGLIRIYVGNATQTRINPGGTDAYYANGMNYRNICWALFMDFKLGRIPQPRTYQFIIRRLPKCLRDDGTTVSGILTRGSNSTVHPNYIQANPAAMLYEGLTNKLWGRGRASAIFNEQSFIDCSIYFAAKNIGIGWTLGRAGETLRIRGDDQATHPLTFGLGCGPNKNDLPDGSGTGPESYPNPDRGRSRQSRSAPTLLAKHL
jgi:hypothetical protein